MSNDARKQLLLTRMALERAQWTREVDELQRLASPQRLLPAALRAAFGPGRFAGLFGRQAGRAGAGPDLGLFARVLQGLVLLQRHPVLSSVLAGALPWVRQRGRWGRLALWVPLGVGVAAAAWAVVAKRRSAPHGD